MKSATIYFGKKDASEMEIEETLFHNEEKLLSKLAEYTERVNKMYSEYEDWSVNTNEEVTRWGKIESTFYRKGEHMIQIVKCY